MEEWGISQSSQKLAKWSGEMARYFLAKVGSGYSFSVPDMKQKTPV